jgi:hypothetical protein
MRVNKQEKVNSRIKLPVYRLTYAVFYSQVEKRESGRNTPFLKTLTKLFNNDAPQKS